MKITKLQLKALIKEEVSRIKDIQKLETRKVKINEELAKLEENKFAGISTEELKAMDKAKMSKHDFLLWNIEVDSRDGN